MIPPSQPTPGPWMIELYNNVPAPIYVGAPGSGNVVASVMRNPMLGDAEANARLIAAAPEMLVILRGTLVALPNHTADCPMGPGPIRIQPSGSACCLFSETHANARALLARIEGKETP